jgi:periplasmic divalent cation tolerance protein
MNEVSLLYCTFPDQHTFELICNELVRQKLVACYNQFPIQSGYIWENEMKSEQEIGCLLKTKPSHLNRAIAALESLHPYDTPCILNWEVTANEKYRTWIDSCLDLS